jgi:hypothetical protein
MSPRQKSSAEMAQSDEDAVKAKGALNRPVLAAGKSEKRRGSPTPLSDAGFATKSVPESGEREGTPEVSPQAGESAGRTTQSSDAPVALKGVNQPDPFGAPLSPDRSERGLGRTLYPSSVPSDEERRAEETTRAQSFVDGFVRATVRRQRAVSGLVEREYADVRRALETQTAEVPDLIGINDPKAVARSLLDAWQTGADAYGRTGSAFEPARADHSVPEVAASLQRLAESGSPEVQRFVQFLTAGARLQDFGEGRAGKELIAHVALTQAPDGTVLEASLSQPSGFGSFDRWVLESARSALAGVRFDAGGREKRFFSLWKFKGTVSYLKKSGHVGIRDVVQSLSLMALNSLVGGRIPAAGGFDVGGTFETIDLTSPHFSCRVTMLEAE